MFEARNAEILHDPFNRSDTAKAFAERKLFHHPQDSLDRLGVEGFFPGEKVLDIGSGSNDLVELMRQQGADAIGVDFAEPGGPQSPDVTAESHHLPFADNSFDRVVNHYGGLTYPLKEGFEDDFPVEVQKEMVIRFLEQLSETLRVVNEQGQIHMYPWSAYPFYDLTGTLNTDNAGFFNKGIDLLRVDFRKLFDSAGLSAELSPLLVTGKTIMAPRDTAIIITKSGDFDPSAIVAKIEKIKSSTDPLFLPAETMKDEYPVLYDLTREVSDVQGLINYYYDQEDYAEATLNGTDIGGLLEIDDNRQPAAQMGINLDETLSPSNIRNYKHYVIMRRFEFMEKLNSIRGKYLEEFNKIELL